MKLKTNLSDMSALLATTVLDTKAGKVENKIRDVSDLVKKTYCNVVRERNLKIGRLMYPHNRTSRPFWSHQIFYFKDH